MAQTKASPFQFCSRQNLIYLTGKKARSLGDLMTGLREADASLVYHHTHHYLEQHEFFSPEPPNDFAYWALHVLQYPVLAEKLAGMDLWRFTRLEDIRLKLLQVVETFARENPEAAERMAPAGMEFHFMKARTFVFPTPYKASNLEEFKECLGKVSLNSIYHHMFESRLRLERDENDFSFWLRDALHEDELARKFSRFDPYTKTIENLRETMIRLVEQRLEEVGR